MKNPISESTRDCFICHNLQLTPEDSEIFKKNSLEITVEECIKFDGGDVGIVNSDFFKQFPSTKYMSFINVKIDLKSSERIEEHQSIVELKLIASDVRNSNQTNALHSLVNLKKLVLKDCLFEFTTLDKMLLENHTNLTNLTLIDNEHHVERLSTLKYIEEDFFDDLENLESIHLMVKNMTEIPPRFFENKPKLTDAYLVGRFKEFPVGLPETITDLTIAYFYFKHISKRNFENIKKLKCLSIYLSKLEFIDDNTFDDLVDLHYLDLSDNNITAFPSKHVKTKNTKLKRVELRGNPCYSNSIWEFIVEFAEYIKDLFS